MNYVLCGAQQKAGTLGLLAVAEEPRCRWVPAGRQHARPRQDARPAQLNGCNNPTYSDGVNHLIMDAPHAVPCDKVGTAADLRWTAAPPATSADRARGRVGPGPAGRQRPGPGADGQDEARQTDRRTAPLGTRPTPSASASTDPETGLPVSRRPGSDGWSAAGAVPVALQTPSSSKNWLLPLLTARRHHRCDRAARHLLDAGCEAPRASDERWLAPLATCGEGAASAAGAGARPRRSR